MIHRSRTEIIASVLQTLANGGATRAEVMYGSFLTFEQATDHLSYLAERNLISCNARTSRYSLTKRGMELLDLSEGTANLVAIAPFDKVGASF
jgi:predicted transcriptional regulator